MEKSKIEWCDSTWNPVSGCYHPCPYCYARSTANRFKGCDCAAGGETDENVVYLKERLTVTSKDGVTRNAAYPFGFIIPSASASASPDFQLGTRSVNSATRWLRGTITRWTICCPLPTSSIPSIPSNGAIRTM